eukprot:632379-Amphidinium_carterae.1
MESGGRLAAAPPFEEEGAREFPSLLQVLGNRKAINPNWGIGGSLLVHKHFTSIGERGRANMQRGPQSGQPQQGPLVKLLARAVKMSWPS